MTFSEKDAEDIVQDVMMRMWDIRANWSMIDNFEHYCMTLVRNFTIDRMRSLQNRYKTEEIRLDAQDKSPSPEDRIEQKETERMVQKIIRKLPEIQQEVIRLREFEELSYKQISEQMHISEDQVKVTLYRARKKIKEMYEKFNQNERPRHKNTH
ncbi:sigma-70 family RNA polymerase sigma factor [Coprobacter sp. LH1063]|uniref:Sigma-70 family RNA polymerase sigma factor n=2 Tax=Coprobacter tertius TaxID=2944915 RepID=A0ABT1MEY0_9BACT|nr:sigma-70 family RNA polymerase sigma factor [Coprobacter tertius]